MSVFFSEIDYEGTTDQEVLAIAAPEGTDLSGYTVEVYGSNGNLYVTFDLGSPTSTEMGSDMYVLDENDPQWVDWGGDGFLWAQDAVALVDDTGSVLQFLSWEGNTVTAGQGSAAGMTSTNIGTLNDPVSETLQTDDDGATYHVETNTESEPDPACFAAGTLIETPEGPQKVETLQVGATVIDRNGAPHLIEWCWNGLTLVDPSNKSSLPIRIMAGALGPNRPKNLLVVSPQHRIAVGVDAQLEGRFASPGLVPAKALVGLPGISYLTNRKQIKWCHFACAQHVTVIANGAISESFLPGPMAENILPKDALKALIKGADLNAISPPQPALPLIRVSPARRAIFRNAPQRTARTALLGNAKMALADCAG